MIGGGKITFRMIPHTHQRCLEGSNRTLYTSETESAPPSSVLSVSCSAVGQQWPATEAGALDAVDLGCHKPLGGGQH